MKLVSLLITLVCLILIPVPKKRCQCCLPPGAVAARFVELQGQTGPLHWGHSVVTYSFDANVPDYAKTSFAASFGQWSKAVNGWLTFKEVANGDISISWDVDASQTANLTNLSYLAYTTPHTENVVCNGNEILGAKIVVNAFRYNYHSGSPRGVTFNPTGNPDVDIDGVSLHEIGHALGLGHSDLNPEAILPPGDVPTMNSILFAGSEKLHQDDIMGIINIYSSVNFAKPTDFTNLEQVLYQIKISHVDGLPRAIPKQIKGIAQKAISLGNTVLFFDGDGKYLGELANRRFIQNY